MTSMTAYNEMGRGSGRDQSANRMWPVLVQHVH